MQLLGKVRRAEGWSLLQASSGWYPVGRKRRRVSSGADGPRRGALPGSLRRSAAASLLALIILCVRVLRDYCRLAGRRLRLALRASRLWTLPRLRGARPSHSAPRDGLALRLQQVGLAQERHRG